jgi:hypothetical protein
MLYTAESYGKHVLKISENDICFSVPIDHLSVDERDARPGTGIPDDGRNRRRILQRKRPPLSRRLQQFERGAAVQVRIAHLSVSTLNRELWTILPTRVFIFARREHVLHPSIGLAGPTAGGSPDVVLCPALAPFIADRLRGVLRC